jgi:hypothetical protein
VVRSSPAPEAGRWTGAHDPVDAPARPDLGTDRLLPWLLVLIVAAFGRHRSAA